MTTPTAQLEAFVADVLIPRIDELVNAASNGEDNEQLRTLFCSNISDGLKFFYERWTPVYLSIHGQKKTTHANRTLDKLFQDVINVPATQLHETLVKAIWYLLSISLEDMDNVPVFPDELTFTELQSAIKNATRRIS
jgi:hypothetical protein